eukprot:gene17774-21202_t
MIISKLVTQTNPVDGLPVWIGVERHTNYLYLALVSKYWFSVVSSLRSKYILEIGADTAHLLSPHSLIKADNITHLTINGLNCATGSEIPAALLERFRSSTTLKHVTLMLSKANLPTHHAIPLAFEQVDRPNRLLQVVISSQVPDGLALPDVSAVYDNVDHLYKLLLDDDQHIGTPNDITPYYDRIVATTPQGLSIEVQDLNSFDHIHHSYSRLLGMPSVERMSVNSDFVEMAEITTALEQGTHIRDLRFTLLLHQVFLDLRHHTLGEQWHTSPCMVGNNNVPLHLIKNQDVVSFCQVLRTNSHLKRLSITNPCNPQTCVSSESLETSPLMQQEFSRITESQVLEHIRLTQMDILTNVFFTNLSTNTNLTSLDLCCGTLRLDQLEHLATALLSNKTLKTLSIRENNLQAANTDIENAQLKLSLKANKIAP